MSETRLPLAQPEVVSRPPTALLAPFVSSLWFYRGGRQRGRERIVPTGAMQLLVNLDADVLRSYRGDRFEQALHSRGACLAGAFSIPRAVDAGEQRCLMGVAFRPGGAAPFVDVPMDTLSNDHVALDTLWGRDGAVLRERLLTPPRPEDKLDVLTQILTEQLRHTRVQQWVAPIVRRLSLGERVAEVRGDVGMAERTLTRRFTAAVGMSPKRFGIVQRFQRVIADAARNLDGTFAELAQRHGYFDQAHMVADFHRFAGVAPSNYRPRSPSEPNHVPIEVDRFFQAEACRRSR